MAIGATERYAAARDALAHYDAHGPNTISTWGMDIREGGSGKIEPYSLVNAAASMADALRALIEPPATTETPAQIAQRVMWSHNSLEASEENVAAMIGRGVLAGIQAAWEDWEPDETPGVHHITQEQYDNAYKAYMGCVTHEGYLFSDILDALGVSL